jgi:hypothetical protein
MSSKVVFHVMCRACFVSGNSDDDECVKVKVECRLRASSGRGRGGPMYLMFASGGLINAFLSSHPFPSSALLLFLFLST